MANSKIQPFARKQYEYSSRTLCDLSSCTKEQVKEYFLNTYNLDEGIFAGIKEAQYFYKCPDRLRLPIVFYVAHPASVYVNKLMLAGLLKKRVNPEFESLFETGVDEMSWDDTENYRMGGTFRWPSMEEVFDYRERVKKVILDVIDNTPLNLPITQDSPWWSVFMGFDHERIHIETSSVLIRQMPIDCVQKPEGWKYAPAELDGPPGPNSFIKVPAGKAVLGKPKDFPTYGWDNEYGYCEVDVPEFEASKYPVTNREFFQFVNDGGYQNKDLWTAEGWHWVQFRKAVHPTFWVCDQLCNSGCGGDLSSYSHCHPKYFSSNGHTNNENGSANGLNGTKQTFLYRAIYDLLPMPWDWPVEVNYHEAKAFCKWKGDAYRVPTEAEYKLMRCDKPITNTLDCDAVCDPGYPANHNLKFGSSNPVNMYPPNSLGFHDIYGNVWEWTEDHFNGLPGFATTYLYDDFSTPCFDGRHNMISGGSWISGYSGGSRFGRYAFRRHFFQHMGFRLVRFSTEKPAPVRLCKVEVFIPGAGVQENAITVPCVGDKQFFESTNIQFNHETMEYLNGILSEQYQEDSTKLLVDFCDVMLKKYDITLNKAAEFGCGTGLACFLLTKLFNKVMGVDYSGRLIDASEQLKKGKTVTDGTGFSYDLKDYVGIKPSRCIFKQMTWVPNEISGYNFTLFSCLDRLTNPTGWFLKLWEVLIPGGLLVVVTKKWNTEDMQTPLSDRFSLCEEQLVAGKKVSVWKFNHA